MRHTPVRQVLRISAVSLLVVGLSSLPGRTAPADASSPPPGPRAAASSFRPGWTGAVSLSRGLPSDSPTVATDSDGTETAAWRAFDGSHWRIQVAVHRPGSMWTKPVFVSPASVDAAQPQVAALDHGLVTSYRLVTWLAGPAGSQALEVSLQRGRGAWSTPVTLAASARRPTDVLALADEYTNENQQTTARPLVFWRDFDGAHWRVQAAQLAADGSRVVRRETLSAPGEDAVDLGMWGRAGWFVAVSWSRYDGTYWRAQYLAFQPEEPLPSIAGVTTVPSLGEDMTTPLVAQLASVWTNDSGGSSRLRGQLCSLDGTCAAPATLSSDGATVTALQGLYELQLQSATDYLVVWQEHQPGSVDRVMAVLGTSPDHSPPHWNSPVALSAAGADTGLAASDRPTSMSGSPLLVAWPQTLSGASGMAWSAFDPTTMTWSPPAPIGDASAPTSVDATELNAGTDGSPAGPGALVWTHQRQGTPGVFARGFDWQGPTVTTVVASPRVMLGSVARVTWAGVDDWSGVASYDVNERYVGRTDRRWTRSRLLTGTSRTGMTLRSMKPGTYWYGVRATDTRGHVGAWTWFGAANYRPTYLFVPYDDRVFVRAGGWSREAGSRYYRGSALVTTHRGATLTVPTVRTDEVRLLVATGPRAGRVVVTFAGQVRRVLSLRSATPRTRVFKLVYDSPTLTELSGRVRIRVISAGRPVRIDGILLARRS